LGTFSPFLYAFREREKILDLFEEACGARLTYSYITVGGATADLPPGWLQRGEKFLDQLDPVIAEYHALLTSNAIFVRRTGGIGVMPPAQPALQAMGYLGERMWRPSAPQGFADVQAAWIDGLAQRLDIANRIAGLVQERIEPDAFVETALGPLASDETRKTVARADSRQQALTLAMMSPEFQRR